MTLLFCTVILFAFSYVRKSNICVARDKFALQNMVRDLDLTVSCTTIYVTTGRISRAQKRMKNQAVT